MKGHAQKIFKTPIRLRNLVEELVAKSYPTTLRLIFATVHEKKHRLIGDCITFLNSGNNHMTQKQIQIIKKSWRIFMKIDPVTVGGLFYDKLFHDFPELEKMFTNTRQEQAKKLIEMVNIVVMRLDRLTELTEDIRQMAIRHVTYGVVPVHYQHVGAALLWTLERGLGSDWNPELAEAWTQCYTLLADTMISATGQQPKQES